VTSGVSQTEAEAAVMATTATKFENVNAGLQSMLKTLMSELSGLSGAWKGVGAAEFEKVKQQYAADLQALNRALSDTAEAVRSSGQNYSASDANAASRITKSGGGHTLPL
jgi:WXG100 family type VII secretion target